MLTSAARTVRRSGCRLPRRMATRKNNTAATRPTTAPPPTAEMTPASSRSMPKAAPRRTGVASSMSRSSGAIRKAVGVIRSRGSRASIIGGPYPTTWSRANASFSFFCPTELK